MYVTIVRLGIQLLAGLGVAKIGDMFIKDKVPAQYYPEPLYKGNRSMIMYVIVFLIGIIATRFVAKSLKITQLSK